MRGPYPNGPCYSVCSRWYKNNIIIITTTTTTIITALRAIVMPKMRGSLICARTSRHDVAKQHSVWQPLVACAVWCSICYSTVPIRLYHRGDVSYCTPTRNSQSDVRKRPWTNLCGPCWQQNKKRERPKRHWGRFTSVCEWWRIIHPFILPHQPPQDDAAIQWNAQRHLRKTSYWTDSSVRIRVIDSSSNIN